MFYGLAISIHSSPDCSLFAGISFREDIAGVLKNSASFQFILERIEKTGSDLLKHSIGNYIRCISSPAFPAIC